MRLMFTNRKAILHVDDDPAMTRIVATHLSRAGFEMEAVHEPHETLDRIVRGSFRIVLLDIHMPGQSGLKLLTEIKSHDAGIQVIMLTGMVNELTIVEANRLGAEACLFKDRIDPPYLLKVVEAAYERNCGWWNSLRDLTQLRQERGEDGPCLGATGTAYYVGAK